MEWNTKERMEKRVGKRDQERKERKKRNVFYFTFHSIQKR